jgi:hypothetical protein
MTIYFTLPFAIAALMLFSISVSLAIFPDFEEYYLLYLLIV